jgi:uncharacterized protein (DUF885 family)
MKNARALWPLLALCACSSWKAPAPPPGEPGMPPPIATAKRAKPESPSAKLEHQADRLLDSWQSESPEMSRTLGFHELDGRVADFSEAAIRARIQRLKDARAELDRVDAKALDANAELDRELLVGEIDQRLFRLEDRADWQKNPRFYEEIFGVSTYVDRDYAPIEERGRRLVAHELAGLAQAPHILENLKFPMSKPLLETSVKIFRGYAEYLRGDVVKLFKSVGTKEEQADFAATNELLAKQADALADRLKAEIPKGDASHVLGVAAYKKLLRAQEGLSIELPELKKMGEDDLARNKAAYVALKKKARFTKPQVKDLIATATGLVTSSREMIEKKHLVTIPTDERAEVRETPLYERWNAAFLDPPGPYETQATKAFFYITPPDASWKKADQDAYLMPFGILMATSVHEVYPGHFLQAQWIKKAPTRTQKSLSSYSFVEGWAHYGEQMIIEEGFGADDAQNQLGQLSDALLRNCRFVVSIGLHTENMTIAQAERRFANDCFQEKVTAHEQAVRGTFDPGYFAYTLGKIQILALREEAKKKLGAKFSLQRFHDALLSHGSPPVPLIRARVLAELE